MSPMDWEISFPFYQRKTRVIQTMKGTDRSLFPSSSNYLPFSLLTSISPSLFVFPSGKDRVYIHSLSLPSSISPFSPPILSLPEQSSSHSVSTRVQWILLDAVPMGHLMEVSTVERERLPLTDRILLSLRTLCFFPFLFPHLKPIDRRTDRKGESVLDSERDRETAHFPFPGPKRL